MTTSKDQARASLEVVFRDVFDDDGISLADGLSREDLPGWDSLGHIRLVSAVEETFGISFTIEQIESMTSVDGILDLVVAAR